MPPGFRVSIGADPGEAATVAETFSHFATTHALPAAVRRGMSIALDELLTNIVSHGLADRAVQVIIECELHADRLTVTISDDGVPFDPLGRPDPDTTLSVEDRPIGGQGIHLVRRLVDDIRYQRHADRNVVVMTKQLAGRVPADHREEGA